MDNHIYIEREGQDPTPLCFRDILSNSGMTLAGTEARSLQGVDTDAGFPVRPQPDCGGWGMGYGEWLGYLKIADLTHWGETHVNVI
jgi:hypothetical protein